MKYFTAQKMDKEKKQQPPTEQLLSREPLMGPKRLSLLAQIFIRRRRIVLEKLAESDKKSDE